MDKQLNISQASVAQALAADYFCIYYVNADSDRFIEYSASPEFRTLGLPAAGEDFLSFIHGRFGEFVHADDRELFRETFAKDVIVRAIDAHGFFTMTFRLFIEDVPTYVHLKVTRMIEKEGRHLVVGISSVDEQMKAREAFERAHSASITYSRIAQALAEDYFCIYYVDMQTDRYFEYSSDASYRELGLARSGDDFFAATRDNARLVMHPEDQGAFLTVFTKENLQKVLDEHKTFTLSYRLILRGRPGYVSMKATRMKDDNGNHVIIGINNIDAQMRQQAELRQAEEDRITYSRVAQALAGDFFSIYVVDLDTDRFLEYSATREYDSLGVEKEGDDFFTVSRKNMNRIIYPDDRDRFMGIFTREKVLSILERDGSFTMKYRLVFGETPVWVSMKATLLDDKDGRHLIVGTNNIDAQMRREQEYLQRMADAKNSAKNDFLANMSHDIRTPMNAIVGYTNIARERIGDPAAVRESLDKIGSASHFLLSLINDVLDISKIESGKMQLSPAPCDLAAVFRRIEDITSLQARQKSLNIRYHKDNVRHFHVLADELRLEQILINIISNAIKYTPEGKDVTLTAEELDAAEPGKNRYRFIIRDTGMGISEEYLPHIFDSFTREQRTTINRVQGTGLGLAITANVVRLMGGTISVKSSLGEGSEFTVELELESSEPAEAAGAEAEDTGAGELAGKRVLVVEDNDVNAEIVCMVLQQYGIEARRAENGRVAVDMLRGDPGFHCDGILMDIQMPVMNGFEAAGAIRAFDRSIPIIAMSANAYTEDVKACLEAGMNAHLAKPFQQEELLKLLKKYLCA